MARLERSDQGSKEKDEKEEALLSPSERFTDPRKSFDETKEALLTRYYAAGLTEEDLYRGAVQGMLQDVDPKMHKWNKLLSPREHAELANDLKGEIVGIGVKIKFDEATGHIDVLSIVPGSPAEKVGIHAGDLILSVNGKLFKGKSEHDVVGEIRGKVGERVELSVLRDDKISSLSVVRATVVLDEVTHRTFGDVGYVSIHMFSAKTPPALKSGAGRPRRGRWCPGSSSTSAQNSGGSFDEAVSCANLFLPAGTPIVTLERREGKMETLSSKGSPVLAATPFVVLVDHGTSSGAELLTAALAEGRHAKTVGTRTYGKWSVQMVDELPNGYAIKYTTALFHAPSGKTYQGVGLTPDVEVDAEMAQVERASSIADPTERVAADVQLRTALALLKK